MAMPNDLQTAADAAREAHAEYERLAKLPHTDAEHVALWAAIKASRELVAAAYEHLARKELEPLEFEVRSGCDYCSGWAMRGDIEETGGCFCDRGENDPRKRYVWMFPAGDPRPNMEFDTAVAALKWIRENNNAK